MPMTLTRFEYLAGEMSSQPFGILDQVRRIATASAGGMRVAQFVAPPGSASSEAVKLSNSQFLGPAPGSELTKSTEPRNINAQRGCTIM